jgi:antitoxin VapB
MAMNIKDRETEELAAEVARLSGVSKTAAVRESLRKQRDRLANQESADQRYQRFMRFLTEEIWPQIPEEVRGTSLTKEEEEELLGIGPEGV